MTLGLQDAAMAGLWLVVTSVVIWSSFRLCRRLYPEQSLASNVLVTTVMAVGNIHFSLVLAGACGVLSPWPAWSLALLVAGIIGNVERHLRSPVSPTVGSGDRKLGNDVGLEPSSKSIKASRSNVIWWVVASAYVGHVVANGLLAFPEDWDTLMYHLPFIDFWIQSGSLATTQSARWSTPATGELIGAWFVLPFSGDFLASLTNLPVFILLASGVIELSRQLRLTGIWPHLVAIVCLATHVTFRQSVDVSNDAAVAAFFLCGLAFAFRYVAGAKQADACLFGICFGLLCGVKYFALGYAVVLLGMWVGLCSYRWQVVLTHQIGAAVLASLSGSYWYIRNWWMTGFPLYPKGSPDMSERILYEDLSKTTLVGNGDPSVANLLIEAVWDMAGPLHLAALAAIPAVVIAAIMMLLSAFRHRKLTALDSATCRFHFIQLVFIAGMVGCGCIWAITPMLVEDQPGTLNHLRWGYGPVRYGLTFLSMAVIAVFVASHALLQSFSSRANAILALGASAIIVFQIVLLSTRIVRFDLIAACLIGANVGLAALLIRLLEVRFPKFSFVLVPLAFVMVSGCVAILSDRWHRGFAEHFDRYDNTTIYSEGKTATHRILVLSNRVYPFFGSWRQNQVHQPMLYYGADAVASSCESLDADLVATRIDDHKILARYRPCWEELAKDPRFEEVNSASERLRLFRYRNLAVEKR